MARNIPSRLCIYCQQEKAWIFSGKKLKDGSKVYTNEYALRWAGRRCPDCERLRVNAAVKCDSFERDLVVAQLEHAGFAVRNKTLPIKAEKEGQVFAVGIRHAHAESTGKIILDKKSSTEAADIYALVFSSVRLCSATQLASLESKPEPAPSKTPLPLACPQAWHRLEGKSAGLAEQGLVTEDGISRKS